MKLNLTWKLLSWERELADELLTAFSPVSAFDKPANIGTFSAVCRLKVF